MRSFKILGICILLAVLASSCASKRKVVQQQNQSYLYTPGSGFIHPEYVVFHYNDTASQLLIRLNTDELLFNQANPENAMQAKVKIQYQLFDITTDPANKKIADSATIIRKFDKQNGKRVIVTSLSVKALPGKIYSMRISLSDIIHNTIQQNMITVNKMTHFSSQNFKVLTHPNDAPLFRLFLNPDEPIHILSNQANTKKLFLRYHKDTTPLPLPPFSVAVEPTFIFKADSIWVFDYNPQQAFLLRYKGFYFIQTDTTQKEGLLLANFGENYPKIKDAQAMIPPLEFITTSEEFRKLQSSDKYKLTADNYWLGLNGNPEITRELIRIYYTRMTYANQYFTSYKEGWKTDRGMIYMIFGPPSYINKGATTETWEYYVRQDATNLSITFNKIATPYSENHYIMNRSDMYGPFWRTAVDSWRKGKVYSIEE